jgi:glutathione gamma-glutamylcysteinyltransferase
MNETLYRRPLPEDTIAFSSAEGRKLFAEALAAGGLDGYFPLAEQFHTQSDPAFCGLGSLVVALNALGIDPGRLWKGPWRWFAEDLLDCCVPLSQVRERGIDLDQLACLAGCNGAEATVQRPDAVDVATWRAALAAAARGETVLIAAYDRAALGQTGSGHFSPLGGYHQRRDLALVLDVARFKYPPHWISAERLWRAMQSVDPSTGRTRGWLTLRRRDQGIALGFTLHCNGESWQALGRELGELRARLDRAAGLNELGLAVAPLIDHLELRTPTADAHRSALAAARASLRALPAFAGIAAAVGPERAEATAVLLLASADLLAPRQRAELGAITPRSDADRALVAELANIRAQLSAVLGQGPAEPPAAASRGADE